MRRKGVSNMKTRIGAVLAYALAAAAPAHAQTDPAGLDAAALTRDRVTIGVGVASIPTYEGSDQNRWTPAALIQGNVAGISFITRGLVGYIDVIPQKPGPTWDFQAGPVIALNLDRTRRKNFDDARVEALGERKTALELGGFVGIGKTGVITSPYDKASAYVAYRRDVRNAHDSYVITPTLDYGTPLSRKAFVGVTAEANYIGRGYARTYYSVTPTGAVASGLPTFNADKGWKDWSLSAFATHSLTGDLLHGLGVGAGVRYSRLLNDAKDSPVTRLAGDRDQWYGAVGLTYTF